MARSGVQFVKTIPENSEFGTELLREYDEENMRDGFSVLFNNSLIKVLDRTIVLGDICCGIIS